MLDRTKAPAFQQNNKLEILRADVQELPNGVKTYSVIGGLQHVVKIEVIFYAGRWFEEKTGAAHFASNLISKGTSSKSSFDIARIFDLYGAHLEINPGLDVVSVSLYALTKSLQPVLDLLFEIISDATYPEKELHQAKSIFLQNLKVNQEKTSFQASKLFRKSVFGDVHPYGKELEESIQELSREHVVSHYNEAFQDFFVLISGKVTERESMLIHDTFSRIDWGKTEVKTFDVDDKKPSRVLADKEGSVQSSIRMGKRFIGRSHPQYYQVLLLNHLLGGYFGSRLMKNIREDKGFTYGIYSSIHTLINDNYLVIGADVNKENLEETFDEIRRELKVLRSEKVGQEELDTARNHFIGSLQSEITTPFSHADKWKNILLYNLPENYYSTLMTNITGITSEGLMETAGKYFDESSFFEVAVG